MSTQPPPYQGGFGPPQQPQQQPQPPYGQAPPPQYGAYPPQVPPQQPGPGWGGPPMGPPMGPPPGPPKSSNGAKVAGIVLASVLGLVVVVGGLILALGSDSSTSDTADGATTYKLTLPTTLLDGEYTRGRDLSDQLAKTRPEGEYAAQIDYKGAFYTTSGSGQLLLAGTSSAMKDPSYPRYSMLDGVEQAPSAVVEIPRREFTPDPDGGPLQCEVLSKTNPQGVHIVFPVCSWTDGHTQATVSQTSPKSATLSPEDIDLTAYARKVADIRDEVRVPAGS